MGLGVLVGGLCAMSLNAGWQGRVESGPARVEWDAGELRLDSGAGGHRFSLDGGLRHVAWLAAGGDDVLGGARPDFVLSVDGEPVPSDADWTVAEPVCTRLDEGELRIDIRLERAGLTVTRHYLVYPGLSLLRGWLEIENTGTATVRLADPPIADVALDTAGTLRWMSGAELFGDSWRMRGEPLGAEPRVFDSYDPPPNAALLRQGDGVEARILLGDRPIWPAEGWAHSLDAADVQRHDVTVRVAAGDRLAFVIARGGDMGWDTTEWDPTVTYADGEAFRASEGFSAEQGGGAWRYEYLGDDGHREEMVYDPAPGRYGERWRRRLGVIEPFIGATELHPDPEGCAVRVFVAPRDGEVRVSGGLRNTGNGAPPGPGFRLGTMTYAPWFALQTAGRTAFLGFDCMAHWHAEAAGGALAVRLAGYGRDLAPGDAVRTPSAFCGLIGDDLDEMGQELLEWQYRYEWQWTREPWFPAIRMLGYWMKGTNWGTFGWVGGGADMESAYRKVFRTADFMRQVGGDTYHRDWGWWDKAGDWNGPDFRSSGEYLRQYGMGQLIYAFIYTVDGDSSVARAHPEWLANPNTLDQSLPAVVDYEVDLLDQFYQRWGPYQWRNDSGPLAPRDGDDTVLLGQQQGFMEVLRRFLTDHPDCAFQGVNGGGMALNWEYLTYASGFQFTDGQSGALAGYYATYLFPPDKINNMPDIWDPARYDPATWRGLLCTNYDLTGDTFDPEQLEGIRLIGDIYHYLQDRGVAGRWGRVYHPVITGNDETMYLQRLSWDRRRGVIITKHRLPEQVTVRPKGLLPELDYEVTFQDSTERFTRRGDALMARGIALTDAAPGELVYLNLSDHPGNPWDATPPAPPTDLRQAAARWMAVPGVELRWQPGGDETWLSGHLVYRDGERLERVDKGSFYFDHSAGADPAALYEVRAIDGSGNESTAAAATPAAGPRRSITDDAELAVTGTWTQETDVAPRHAGTLSRAESAGAAFELRFAGRAVTWHGRLGAAGGLARVLLDGEPVTELSCYAADEIPGWPVFEHAWDEAGEHTLRVEALGTPDPRGSGTSIWVDAIAVQP